jgi:hypothetical protein
VPPLDSAFKNSTIKTMDNPVSVNSTPSNEVLSKQPKSKPVDLLTMQKRDFDAEKQWR